MAFNWFDVTLVLALAFGLWRGRRHGMSREFLPASQWLTLVIAAGFGHEMFSQQLIQWQVIKKVFGKNFDERTAAMVSAYLLIAFAVLIVFTTLRRIYSPKLAGSNAFGSGEYYLGMIAGFVRYACILIAVLALLNAPFYSSAEIMAKKAYKNRWYGGGMKEFSGDYIPDLNEIQAGVFKESLLGPVIKDNLGLLLINTTSASKNPAAKTPVINIQH